jgi:YegS/Rv2252/BmrU family lipid kinase
LFPRPPSVVIPRLKTRFIVNLRSGRATRAFPRVQAFADAHGASVVLTARPRHATELAHEALAAGCDRVVAVGGDGTLNEVASALVGTDATLGLVPCGSGDGLGRHLGIHGPVTRALEILHAGKVRVIDTGLADGHPFFTAAGLGFEAEVATHFNRLEARGFLRYLATSSRLWRRHAPVACRIEQADGTRLDVRAFTLAVANSDQYGNNARIAPGARVDDGLLDLSVVINVTAWNALPLLARLFTGSIERAANLRRFRGTRFIVERPAPGLIHTDGETHLAGSRVEFRVRPRSLRVVAPGS